MDQIEEVLTRGVANINPSKEELEKKIRSGKKLNIYCGFDATAPKLHLGHSVPFRKLNKFAEMGHNVTFLIGDFTTLIGDNSDKESERPVLTTEEIENNLKTYKQQAGKILDFSKIKLRFNSEWLKKLSFADIVRLSQNFSVGDFIGRELIKKRLNEGKRVGLHELLYPIMQGYDHYYMDTDIQIGATEQTFNLQAGRTLQKILRNKESFFLTFNILEGTDGRRMSKSWGNAIWLEDSPNDMYGKVMAIRDDLIVQYFTLATNVPMEDVAKIEKEVSKDPMSVKKKLAFEIVKELHGGKEATQAINHFEKTVQQKEMPENIELITFNSQELTIIQILKKGGLVESNSEAKRLIEQGGVSIDDRIIKDSNKIVDLKNEHLLKIGKRKFLKIKSK